MGRHAFNICHLTAARRQAWWKPVPKHVTQTVHLSPPFFQRPTNERVWLAETGAEPHFWRQKDCRKTAPAWRRKRSLWQTEFSNVTGSFWLNPVLPSCTFQPPPLHIPAKPASFSPLGALPPAAGQKMTDAVVKQHLMKKLFLFQGCN